MNTRDSCNTPFMHAHKQHNSSSKTVLGGIHAS
uniref:Uncharacterized protein n=1 Tax=Arundo donax TaxID=35708 RepID=A0A0A8XSW4_ARUDO